MFLKIKVTAKYCDTCLVSEMKYGQICTLDLMLCGPPMLVLGRNGLVKGFFQQTTSFLHDGPLVKETWMVIYTAELKNSQIVTFFSKIEKF